MTAPFAAAIHGFQARLISMVRVCKKADFRAEIGNQDVLASSFFVGLGLNSTKNEGNPWGFGSIQLFAAGLSLHGKGVI
ncbi:hypothetical protein [Abditibacterium utsteinense]|uniref:hypothetical protein n=1 Tax=Abditibacterium utsteinense TaxID=1960156 RepID=UPI001EE70C0E|nr:hypothetical protein [Abditibacterium utsteinense]